MNLIISITVNESVTHGSPFHENSVKKIKETLKRVMQSKTREVKKRDKTSGKKRRKYLPGGRLPQLFGLPECFIAT